MKNLNKVFPVMRTICAWGEEGQDPRVFNTLNN